MKIEARVALSQFAGAVERVRRQVVDAVARNARRQRSRDQGTEERGR